MRDKFCLKTFQIETSSLWAPAETGPAGEWQQLISWPSGAKPLINEEKVTFKETG